MVRVDGDLDPETGEHLLTALRAVLDAEARSGTDGHGSGANALARTAPPPSAGPTPWERSAASGWTAASDRWWPANGRT